jgi:hypothetical protein
MVRLGARHRRRVPAPPVPGRWGRCQRPGSSRKSRVRIALAARLRGFVKWLRIALSLPGIDLRVIGNECLTGLSDHPEGRTRYGKFPLLPGHRIAAGRRRQRAAWLRRRVRVARHEGPGHRHVIVGDRDQPLPGSPRPGAMTWQAGRSQGPGASPRPGPCRNPPERSDAH